MKTPVSESLFEKSFRTQPATLFKKIFWRRCFLVNFAILLRMPFLKGHFRWLLLSVLSVLEVCSSIRAKKNVSSLVIMFYPFYIYQIIFCHEFSNEKEPSMCFVQEFSLKTLFKSYR